MCQDENLLNKIALDLMSAIIRTVVADFYHFAYNGTDDEECITVKTGHGVINNNDFFFSGSIGIAALDLTVEIQKRKEMTFSIAKTNSDVIIRTNDLVLLGVQKVQYEDFIYGGRKC